MSVECSRERGSTKRGVAVVEVEVAESKSKAEHSPKRVFVCELNSSVTMSELMSRSHLFVSVARRFATASLSIYVYVYVCVNMSECI